jgi:drug/metabolite transporter (DMT)-like permease
MGGMVDDLEKVMRNENKSRVRWGFFWAFTCAVLWGLGYVALSMLWIVPPFGEWLIFPEGASGYLVATIVMTASIAIFFSAILTIFWIGGHGKLEDLPRTIRFFKVSKWYAVAAVFGGPVAIFGSTIAVGYVGAAFAASAALLCSVVGAIAAKLWYEENITKKAWLGICLILVGGVFIWNPSQMISEIMNPASPEGIWIGYLGGFMSALGWGLEGAFAARALDITDADIGLVVRFTSEALIWVFILWPLSMLLFGINTMTTVIIATFTTPSYLIWIIITSLSLGVCYVALYKSLPLIGVGRGLSISTLYVPCAIVFLYIFMGAPVAWWLILGASIAVICTFVMYWESGDSLLESTRDCKPALDELKTK